MRAFRATRRPLRVAVACALWWSVAAAATAAAAEDVSVVVRAQESGYEVDAHATLDVPAELVWRTLTDYGRLAQFIPGLASSRVVGRDGTTAFVEQKGRAGYWFLFWPIDVTLASTERPPNAIDVHLVSGNLRRLDGGYRLTAAAGRVVLAWRGILEPKFRLPGFIEERVIASNVTAQFKGMVDEIEKRHGLR